MSQEYKNVPIISLFNGKGFNQMPTDYRGISLPNCAENILARIVRNRLHNKVLESIILEEYCGIGIEGDLNFAACQIQDKCRERCQPLYAMFVDIPKLFEAVDRWAFWKLMGKFGRPSKFTNLIKCFREGMKASVQSSGSTSVCLNAVSGVKQGCVLVPFLFNLHLTAIQMVVFTDCDTVLMGDCSIFAALEPRRMYVKP